MMIARQGYLLRIMIGESDRREGKPLYEWIVLKAKTEGLAGATVFRGMMGFGASSRIHTSKIMRLSEDLPILIEIVDVREKLESFMKLIDGCITSGLATLEKAEIHFYRSGNENDRKAAEEDTSGSATR
jgi:PII-like signaling protein